MPIAAVDDAEIYYETYGDGPPLMLVAGLGGVGTYWQPQVEEFSRHFRVIVHDHRGTGRSTLSRIRYTVDRLAMDALGLMDHLGIQQAPFVGHSTGGAIGQILAAEHPERLSRMVQYASWTKADAHLRLCFDVRKELLLKSGVAAYVHATPLFLMPSWWIRENEERLRELEPAGIASLPSPEIALSRIEAILAFDRTADLDRITTPTLVVCAKDDFLTPPYYSEELAQRIPGARLVMLERGGHACSQIVPAEFNRAVLPFLLEERR